MAETTIGLLRVVLASNSAEFSRDMGKASKAVGQFETDAKGAVTGITTLGGAAKGTEQSVGLLTGSVARMAAGFSAALIVDRLISGVIGFGREAFDSAGKILDLAAKTGLSTKSIQEMEMAAKQTGTTLEAFSNAAFQLGVRLAGGSDSVRGAVQALGLSYKELMALSPDEQFRLIAERLGDVENAQERNKIAVELFGRSAKEILPAIAQGYKDIADSAVIAGDQQLQALDMASDALDSFYVSAKNVTVQLLGGLVIAVRETWRTFKEGMDTALLPFAAAWNTATDAMVAWGIKAQEINKVHGPASAGLRDTTVAAKALTMSWEEMDRISNQLTASVGRKTTVTRTYATALREVSTAVQAVQGPSEKLLYLESRSIQETAKLSQELERWVRVNGGLAPSIRQVSAAIEDQIELVNLMDHQWAQFPGTVQQSTSTAGMATEGFFQRVFGGAEGLGNSLTQIFTQAFTGGGGALGAVKAFATQSLSAMMAMIPGVGPWIKGFAGPIIAMLSNLTRRFGDFFRNLFGGPSADEMAGRELVAGFEDALHGTLTAQQEAESQGEDWRRTVIAIRDAYIAMGRTEEEALRDAERLWESSRQSAEESARVIAEIQRKMRELTGETQTIDIEVVYRTTPPPGASRPGDPESHTMPVDPGFANGTMGRLGRFFENFGSGFSTRLHGVEAVLRPQDALPFARQVIAGMTPGQPEAAGVSNSINILPVLMGSGMSSLDMAREATNYIAKSGLEMNEGGITSAIENVFHNLMLSYYSRA